VQLRAFAAVLVLIVSMVGGSSVSTAAVHPTDPSGAAQAGGRDYFIVRFVGPVEASWKADVEAQGAELLAYLPEFAFKARMTQAQANAVESTIGVDAVEPFPAALKLGRSLRTGGAQLYSIRVERGGDVSGTANAIARLGGVVTASGDRLTVAVASGQLQAIARIADVAFIENYQLREKHNDVGAGKIMGAGTANAAGYDGSTQTVAVADTGLGDGTSAGAHPDISSARVTAIYNWPGSADSCFQSIRDDGAKDVDSGHGTHVSGSVLSDGDASGEGKGTAPAAKLVFQAVENWVVTSGFCKAMGYPDGYYLTGLPSDLKQLFQQAYNAGARVHSNSWGSDVSGDYTADSANTDSFVWTNRDMTITFSAGNAGKDTNADGIVDNDSIGSPATAKNVITVGASENERRDGNDALSYPCDLTLTYDSHDAYQTAGDGGGLTCAEMGGNNLIGTGSRWGFTAEPIKSDPTANSQEQMAAFSSRGPTDDGRIKPDVVAPGTWILSGYSSLHQEGYGDPLNPQNSLYQWDGWGIGTGSAYKWMGGTSMSNPLAAGGAAVVRDFYQEAHAKSASAALVKATLINSAVDMLDENNDGNNDNRNPIPNNHEGWGRVNVGFATDGSHVWSDDNTGVSTNSARTFTTNVTAGAPLKVSVAWSDYPSTESATKNLVNDLDVKVTSPSGVVYLGNVFDKSSGSGGWSLTGGSADRTNNVENVYVRSGEAGTWAIEIRGYNVPNGPQPFALVVDNAGALTETTGGGGGGGGTTTMHVGDLDATRAKQGNGWKSTLTVKIEDSAHAALASASVSVRITGSAGYSATGTCTTSTGGTCSLTTGKVASSNTTLTWTVTGVTRTGYTYDNIANHDPETDSNGTSISVSRP
jgi:serine protease AprX